MKIERDWFRHTAIVRTYGVNLTVYRDREFRLRLGLGRLQLALVIQR